MIPLKAAVITVSTKGAAGERLDESGPVMREGLVAAGMEVVHEALVPDDVVVAIVSERIDKPFERFDANLGTVMELGENIKSDVLMRVGHDAHDGCDVLFAQQVHNRSDVLGRSRVHRLQPTEISEDAEARCDVFEQNAQFFNRLARFIGGDVLRRANDKQPLRSIDLNRIHRHVSAAQLALCHRYFSEAASITKRYLTSLRTTRSYASLT